MNDEQIKSFRRNAKNRKLSVNLSGAKDRDAISIKMLLAEVQNCLKAGESLPEQLNIWFCSVLEELLKEKPHQLAERLKQVKKGRKPQENKETREEIARVVHELRYRHGLHKSENGAYTIIAKQYGVNSANTVAKYYREYRKGHELDDEISEKAEGE